MKVWLTIAILICSIGAALADAPNKSIRPMPRPVLQQQPLAAELPVQTLAAVLPDLARVPPQRRPEITPTAMPEAAPVVAPTKPRKGLLGLIAPRAKPAKPPRKAKASRKGSVCGDPSIKGKTLPRISSKTKGCGIDEPVSVTSVDGVLLSEAATLDCTAARALNTWVQKGLRPALRGNEVVQLQIAGHYSCRTRNNVRGAKISEHGRGKAIDISGIVFANGKQLTVSRNFKSLRKAYKAGCGIFATTLGPGSDGYHEDHMHFDTAKHRSGAYCR
jgi:hypothetical protein